MKERLTKLIKEAQEKYIYAEEQAQYLMDNGVIVPPCKVGDTVYIIDDGDYGTDPYVLDVEVLQLFINEYGIALDLKLPLGFRLNTWSVVGKTVFLTREEAEWALKGGAQE